MSGVALRARVEDSSTGKVQLHTFQSSPVNIGRNALNTLVLSERFVSFWHGLIRFDERTIQYLDLGSTNGSQVNGVEVNPGAPVELRDGMEVGIGTLRLQLSRVPAGEASSSRRTDTAFGLRVSRVEPAAQSLLGRYAEYRKAYLALHERLEAHLKEASEEARPAQLSRLIGRFPALAQERPFLELVARLGLQLPKGVAPSPVPAPVQQALVPEISSRAEAPPPRGPGSAAPGLWEFGRAYLGESRAPSGPEESTRFLERLAEVLEAFGRSFLELMRGQEQFGEELSLRVGGEGGRLRRARDAQELLAYLLDWRAEPGERAEELTRGFTSVMVHQVALLNGLRAGARALLEQLSPGSVIKAAEGASLRIGGIPLSGRVWPFRSLARWSGYVTRHKTLAEEERTFMAVVLGREFARGYALVVGEGERPSNASAEMVPEEGLE